MLTKVQYIDSCCEQTHLTGQTVHANLKRQEKS